MTLNELESLLTRPLPGEVSADFSVPVQASLDYLCSREAHLSLGRDAYWPKWNSPWWHMLTLHEMGLADRLPASICQAMLAALDRYPVKTFPISKEQRAALDPRSDWLCHCAAGSIYSVLSAAGVAVDRELPWLRLWLSSFRMADGGMSCDEDAYLVAGESPSSMVASVPIFEALLEHVPERTAEETWVLDRSASFLLGRQLSLGSDSQYNAEERDSAPGWLLPCFPRLYLYDVLRGLRALLLWCRARSRRVPLRRIAGVLTQLASLAADGRMRIQRRSYEGLRTRVRRDDGSWERNLPATTFPLLEATSVPGQVSPVLTRQWHECLRLLRELPLEPNQADVLLVAPDPGWGALARREAERFGLLLGDNLVEVHHIGSTSIPGIWAKPVIDLLPEVRDVAALDGIAERIRAAGYEYWGEYGLPGRRFCPRMDPSGGLRVNIHCYQSGAPDLKRHLAFRDFLRAHPNLAAEYQDVKVRARELFPYDVFAYNDEKGPWIRAREREALAWAECQA